MSILETEDYNPQEELENLAARNPHLARYIDEWYSRTGRELEYRRELTRDLRRLKQFSIIYPVGEPIFIHVYSREGERTFYHAVTPSTPPEFKDILALVEEGLAILITADHMFETREEHEEILNELLDEFLVVDESLDTWEYNEVRRDGKLVALEVNSETLEALKFETIMEKVYLGPLEPFIRDQYIEDISCDGVGPVFVEHKIFGSCESNIRFETADELDDFVIRLSERTGRPVTYRKPIVDASLPDGSRINIVFGTDISKRGSNFTIRKFSDKPVSIINLIQWGSMSALEAAYLWMLLEYGFSIWFCGETASGKTTAMRAACVFINPKAKIISIEDTPEIIVPHDNWVREVTRQGEQGEASVELFDLLRAALRQRPNYIIVGEIRGAEAYVAFQAMQTGHPVLATFHAGSVEKVIQRLTGDPINIPKTYIDILNCVLIQSAVRIPKTGKVERRVLSINEIAGYDPTSGRFDFIELFSWDAVDDTHIFRGEGNSFLLETKILTLMGLSRRDARKVYEELNRRATLLETLSMLGVSDYNHIWNVVKHCYEKGVEEVLHSINRGEKPWLRD